jgi:hypothetical protein
MFEDEPLLAFGVRRLKRLSQSKLIDQLQGQRLSVQKTVRTPIYGIPVNLIRTNRTAKAIGPFPQLTFVGLISQSGCMGHCQTRDSTAYYQELKHALSLS